MKLRLLDFLVCPIDKSKLELFEWESSLVELTPKETSRAESLRLDPKIFAKEIKTGVLVNQTRKIYYPIHNGIPRLLIFPTGVAEEFLQKNNKRITQELAGFTTPHQAVMTGEETVLRTFSSEWVNFGWDGKSYWGIEPDVIYKSMRWLLKLEENPIKNKTVLEVGIGVGGIADYMARKEGCELVGMDLSYAVDSAYKYFGKNRFLHIIQASAFAPPFLPNTFDLVYSQGVIHHTPSTKGAFDSICHLPKIGGRLYIWVYNPHDEERTLIRRILMVLEKLIRPLCWRLPERLQSLVLLPIIPLYLIHQSFIAKKKGEGFTRYGFREAIHAARDRFTPRFAFRHTEEEVKGWFTAAGYSDIEWVSKRSKPNYVAEGLFYATSVDGVKR